MKGKFGLLVLTALVWLTLFVVAMTSLTADIFSQEIISHEACCICFLSAGVIQLTWGIFAGSINYARGWRSVPESSSNFNNWAGNVAISGVLAVPATMVLAGYNYLKKGKFFPTPTEC